MGFSVMLRGAKKLVPAEYWCPYGTYVQIRELGLPTNFALSYTYTGCGGRKR